MMWSEQSAISLIQLIATYRKIKIITAGKCTWKAKKKKKSTLDISAKCDTEREPTLPCILDNHDLTALIPRSRMKDTAEK